MDKEYIIDSNILISSSRRFYPFDIMPGFWRQFLEKIDGKVVLIDKVKEEIQEFQAEVAHMDKEKAEAEFGDVMFSLINAARLYKINPDNALERTNQKFINRFNYVEAHSIKEGKNLHDMTLEEMDKLWNEAKALEKESKQDDSSKGQV